MSYDSSPSEPHEGYTYAYMTPQSSYGHTYLSDGSNVVQNEESNFWVNSPRTDSPSPNGQNHIVGPYQIYTPVTYGQADRSIYTTEYEFSTVRSAGGPFVRIVKRRTTANKKERRRTQSINNAYADLKDCIPNIQRDTKLSKIKTLRLAASYISYLTGVLETDDTGGGFKAELGAPTNGSSRKPSAGQHGQHVQVNECSSGQISPKSDVSDELSISRRAKGRTGWPQHVWALELKQDPSI